MTVKSSRKRNFADNDSRVAKIKNQETFAYGTHVEEIPTNRLLILDGYAFDIDELMSLPEKDLFTNMHTQMEFSKEAKRTLLSNESLREKAQHLFPKKPDFPGTLIMDTYNLGITLLQQCNDKERREALTTFSQGLEKVHSGIKSEFLNFTIKMSSYNYRVKANLLSTIQVRKLLTDLSEDKICVRAGGNWLIQLVRSMKPDMVNEAYALKLNQEFSHVTPLTQVKAAPRIPAFFADR